MISGVSSPTYVPVSNEWIPPHVAMVDSPATGTTDDVP
jgi:hypothetical protein